MYPRVAEVQAEVAARSEALARRAKPLSHVIPSRARSYALADDTVFASSQSVNPSFAQLAGARAVGSRRWGSISFSEMERLARLFQNQLEVTSSSLWLMSGILAMLKRDSFQPSDPTLFNSALSSVSAALSRQARTSATGSGFIRAKCRDSLLSHTTLPVPEAQRRSLTVTPGSPSGLFNEDLLAEVVSQVQRSSQISSLQFCALWVGGGQLLPPPPHPLLVLDCPVFRVAGRTGSAPLPPLALEVVSASRAERGRLLLPNPRVFGSRSHPLSGPFSGGCLSLHWQAWRDRGAEPWVVEVLRFGYLLPFLSTPPLSATPIPMPSYSPTSVKGAALEEVTWA